MRETRFRQDVFDALAAYAPEMTVRRSQLLTSELVQAVNNWAETIERVSTQDDAENLVRATVWAERNFGPLHCYSKIRCIKELRAKFALSMLGAKSIVDHISWSGIPDQSENISDR